MTTDDLAIFFLFLFLVSFVKRHLAPKQTKNLYQMTMVTGFRHLILSKGRTVRRTYKRNFYIIIVYIPAMTKKNNRFHSFQFQCRLIAASKTILFSVLFRSLLFWMP